ncbi:MAG: dihydroxyacetone kinase subunit DhaL [Friedmanniella sp.]
MTELPQHQALDGAFARRWVAEFVAQFTAQAGLLTDLDRQAGDGDFGANLRSALSKAQGYLDQLEPESFAEVFDAVSKGFLNTGGTSGPLFGMWFRELAKAGRHDLVDVATLAAGAADGLAVIQRLGSAAVGDCTMVDAIAPAAEALAQARDQRDDLGRALAAAAAAARVGAMSTRDLVASRGRASYVGEVARGIPDPGAVAVALFFAAGVIAHGDAQPDGAWLTG